MTLTSDAATDIVQLIKEMSEEDAKLLLEVCVAQPDVIATSIPFLARGWRIGNQDRVREYLRSVRDETYGHNAKYLRISALDMFSQLLHELDEPNRQVF